MKLQDMTTKSLSFARASRMNRKTVGIFCKILDKVATENNLSDTPENIFNTDESGIQINNKPESVIREKGPNIYVLTSGENSEYTRVTACCRAAPVAISNDVNKKQDFSDGLPQCPNEPEVVVH
jgi:hypothetical protein